MLLLVTNPQFRLLWLSFTMTAVSALMYMMVNGWLTLTITDSPFWVGAMVGSIGLGFMAATIPGGVLADRLPRRRLLVGSGLAHAAFIGLLAVPVFADSVQLWHIAAVSFWSGVAGGVRTPAYMAMTLDIAGRDRFLNAYASNSVGMGLAGVASPLIGGAMVSVWHIGWAYVFIAGAELLAAASAARLSDPRRPTDVAGSDSEGPARESAVAALRVGVRYVIATPNVRALILMAMVMEAFGWAHFSMLPVIARDVLGQGASGLGFLQSASFVGFMGGNVVIASLPDVRRKGRLLLFGVIAFALLIMVFAASRSFPLSVVVLAMAYAVASGYDSALGTLLQTIVPDHMRGRVASFQALTWGINGVSGFHTGAIASWLGAPMAVAIGAAVSLAYALRLVPLARRLEESSGGKP